MLALRVDDVAQKPVEITHHVVRSKGKLGLGHGLDGALFEKQVEERPDQGKAEQREENGDQVEDQIHDDAAPIGLDVG